MNTLYLADSPGDSKGKRLLLAYPLSDEGTVGKKKILHDFKGDRGIDGMAIDIKGNLYATAGKGKTAGVTIFDSQGKKLEFIPTPEDPSNCVFGGEDRRMLYITAGKSLYRIHLTIDGFAVYWPK
jgi:gluconolactonase